MSAFWFPARGATAYFSPSWMACQADRGRRFSVIVDDGMARQGERAEALVRAHLTQAAEFMVARLRGKLGAPAA